MYIKQINIHTFGCLDNFCVTFDKGFNVIYGPNESGKTTLMSFVVFAFYGTKVKKGSEKLTFKEKYTPWNCGQMGGEIVFVYDNLTYSLTRIQSGQKKEITLFCEETGENITDRTILDDVGGYFFGVSADTFCKTVFFSSYSLDISGEKSGEIHKRLTNVFESGLEEVSYREISDIINDEILNLSSPKRKDALIPLLNRKIEDLKAKEYNAKDTLKQVTIDRENIEILKNKENDLNSQIQNLLNKKKELDNKCQSHNRKNNGYMYLFSILALVLSMLFFVVNKTLFFVFAILFAVSVFANIIISFLNTRNAHRNEQIKLFTFTEINDKINMLKDRLSAVNLEKAVLEERVRNISFANTEDTHKHIAELEKELETYNTRLDALNIAKSAVDRAYSDVKKVFSPRLAHLTSEIFSCITEGKYTSVLADDLFNLNVHTDRGYADSAMLSRGTHEQLYLSLRLSLSVMMFPQEIVPVFLDDAFNYFDYKRFCLAMDYLVNHSRDRQVILSACRSDEYINLKERNVNIIEF